VLRTPLNPNPTLLAGLNYELVPASGDVSITWDTKVEGSHNRGGLLTESDALFCFALFI